MTLTYWIHSYIHVTPCLCFLTTVSSYAYIYSTVHAPNIIAFSLFLIPFFLFVSYFPFWSSLVLYFSLHFFIFPHLLIFLINIFPLKFISAFFSLRHFVFILVVSHTYLQFYIFCISSSFALSLFCVLIYYISLSHILLSYQRYLQLLFFTPLPQWQWRHILFFHFNWSPRSPTYLPQNIPFLSNIQGI